MIKEFIKNWVGFKTSRKIVVFSVDDYGNVRVDSKKARENMDACGLKKFSRFDEYDTLECTEDLEHLFETLTSVKDKNDHPAVFTPFALTSNLDFEKIIENKFKFVYTERLDKTFEKKSIIDPTNYRGTWDLWKEGIQSGIFVPQFHGKVHFNNTFYYSKMENMDYDIQNAIINRSYTSINPSLLPTITPYATYDFNNPDELDYLDEMICSGVKEFSELFGYQPNHFMPPGAKVSCRNLEHSYKCGLSFVDRGLIHKSHIGFGKYEYSYNYTGRKLKWGQKVIVRNSVFEPTQNKDAVKNVLKSIETIFLMNRPVIISSHRVNYCGHISPKNRELGINALRDLLKSLVAIYPDIEFMSCSELGQLIDNNQN